MQYLKIEYKLDVMRIYSLRCGPLLEKVQGSAERNPRLS